MTHHTILSKTRRRLEIHDGGVGGDDGDIRRSCSRVRELNNEKEVSNQQTQYL